MNLLSGSIGVILCLGGDVRTAFLLMLASAVFDFFDGLAARMLNAYSEIGKELDSLADMVSFGLLPSVLLYETMLESAAAGTSVLGPWYCFLPLVLAVFSALRLAKFNIDERQHDSFIGLATPAAAMICGSLAYYVSLCSVPGNWLTGLCGSPWFIPLLALVLSLLLVSEIPMFSMKFGKGKQSDGTTNILRIAFLCIVALMAVLVIILKENWSLIVLFSFIGYILLNCFNAVLKK